MADMKVSQAQSQNDSAFERLRADMERSQFYYHVHYHEVNDRTGY